ncbi:MAG: hypothetical protein IKW90_14700 [Lachnospiraceae bacterium]|nr:hypothetical protein [Lachnospiraceae bacterium]
MPEYYIYIPKVPNLEKTIQELINLAIDKLINKDQEKLVVEYSGVQLNLLDISLVIIKTDNMTGGTQLFLEN